MFFQEDSAPVATAGLLQLGVKVVEVKIGFHIRSRQLIATSAKVTLKGSE